MAERSITLRLIAIALLLSLLAALLYANQPSVAGIPSPVQWFVLISFALTSQIVVGLALWGLLNRRQQKLVQTEALHSIVHEFQTPIAAIRMAVDILDSPIARNQPTRTEKYVRIIREETERLQHQVETMLTLARADRNTLILNPEPVPIHQLLHSVAERHGDYLCLRLSGSEPMLLADRLHLTNVLHNLLDNAVKYSADQPVITVNADLHDSGFSIAVRDQGVGIPNHLLPQIFQPFFRVHDRNQPSVKGFGLGLSYVQRIVQAHKWTIEVTSQLGQGSEFTIHVPATALLPLQPEVFSSSQQIA
ncbi:sensor histidine kinase [Spirosoma rigui]|uniref:sensor histidine kinase n=1 Tax=Spirosoma rigui TaxID=564064 RepID=UPI0009AFC424|nr:HAMP domain-containing sensor histidine kinase [Spirosoma rigui]